MIQFSVSLLVNTAKMSQSFSLKSHDHLSNWNNSLYKLRNDKEFSDVTLISEDKVKFSAHKVLLSSCSGMFKFILEGHTNAIPLLYLGGVSSKNLEFILDYIYYGEIKIFQEQLDSFLESAKKLEIDSLMENFEDETMKKYMNQKVPIKYPESEESQTLDDTAPVIPKREYMNRNDSAKIDVSSMTPEEIVEKKKELCISGGGMFSCTECEYVTKERSNMNKHIDKHFVGQDLKACGAKIDVSSLTSDEIIEKRKKLCQRIDGMFSCTECEHVTKFRGNMNKHIEWKHFVGHVYRCNHCNLEFSLQSELNNHKSIEHKKDKGIDEIVEKRKELCQRIDGMYFCTECEHVANDRSNMNKHIDKHFVK